MRRPVDRGVTVGVADVMRTHVIAVQPEACLGPIAEMMRLGRLRALPVTDDAGRLLGEITFGACCQAIAHAIAHAGEGEALHLALQEILAMPIRELMSDSQDIVEDGLPLLDGVARLLRAHSGRLLVIGPGGRMVGVMTERDLLLRAIRTPPFPVT